ncbi:MAG TPA: hypothetical protein VFQ32_07880 [Ktedonobacterales bacterium]|nr:hypothetical protein [Ktedonobacterales bacterium]
MRRASSAKEWFLTIARLATWALILLCLITFVAPIATIIARISAPCGASNSSNPNCVLVAPQVEPLARLGVSPETYAIALVSLAALYLLLALVTATVLLWRRPNDWMAMIVAFAVVAYPSRLWTTPLLGHPGVWTVPAQVVTVAGSISLFLLFALFPNGRFVAWWIWIAAFGWVLLNVDLSDVVPVYFAVPIALLTVGLLVAGQVIRYRSISSPVQRQQTKWAVFAIALLLIANQAFWQPHFWVADFHRPDALFPLLAWPWELVSGLVVPICFGIAILRYRLYDIDIIIRRALLYGPLTVTLALIYAGCVVLLQAPLRPFTRTGGDITLVISTLAVAALFRPIRSRIQTAIDRYFYRRKYDAARTLAAFGETLRNDVDLVWLQEYLLHTVEDAVQPSHASLWLRPLTPPSRRV